LVHALPKNSQTILSRGLQPARILKALNPGRNAELTRREPARILMRRRRHSIPVSPRKLKPAARNGNYRYD